MSKTIKPLLTVVKKAVSKIEKIGTGTNDSPKDTTDVNLNSKSNNFLLKWKQIKYIPKFLSPIEKKTIRVASLIIIICLSLLGYLFIKNNVITKPTVGGTYSEIIVGSPQYINPIYASTNEADQDLSKLIFAGLVKFDKNHQLIGDLAKDWFLDKDQKTYTFILRNNIYWPDGEPFTSEDVAFTIRAIQDKSYESPLYLNWVGIQIKLVDDYTIQFILPEPYQAFLENTTLGILPAHLWNEVLPQNARLAELNIKPVGLGPYKFDALTKDEQGYIKSYDLISNKNYHLKTPYIDKIIFKFFPTFELAVEDLKSHNADGLNFLPLNFRKKLEQRNDLHYYSLSLPQYTALFFNVDKNSVLKERTMRQTLNLLINKNTIIKQVLDNEATAITGPILPNMLGYSKMKNDKKDNTKIAKKILAAAGWKYPVNKKSDLIDASTKTTTTSTTTDKKTTNQPKYLIKDGKELTVTLTAANQPQAMAVAEIIKKMWLVAGIKTNLDVIEAGQIQKDIIIPRNFEILLFGEILNNSGDLYPFWHSSQAGKNGLNLTNFKNNAADKLLTAIRKEKITKKKIELSQKFEKIIKDNIPAIFLYNPNYIYVVANKIKGITAKRIVTPSDRFNDIEHWYIKTKKGLK